MTMSRLSVIFVLVACITACGGGGGSGSAGPAIPGLLPGSAGASAVAALATTTASPAAASDIQLGHILTRIEVIMDPGATVAQFNEAARVVSATAILSSATGSPGVTLEVPRQGSIAALNALVTVLRARPGILFAMPARLFAVSVLPESSPGTPVATSDLGHLLISRFPQAWNARDAAGADCLARSVSTYVWDNFGQQSLRPDFLSQIDPASFLAAPSLATLEETDLAAGHGYDVALVLAGSFDGIRPTGALPFAECALVHQIEAASVGWDSAIDRLRSPLTVEGSQRFILNVSFGFPEPLCGADGQAVCSAQSVGATTVASVKAHIGDRIAAATYWALRFRGTDLGQRMLITLAAGNVDDDQDAVDGGPVGTWERRYAGFRDARFVSPVSLATHLAELKVLLMDTSLWRSDTDPSAPDATFSAAEADEAVAKVRQALGGTLASLPATNLVIVDSASCGAEAAASCGEDIANAGRSSANYHGGELRAVGEKVQVDGTQLFGTSFAAPQVAGLAAYLWTLSDTLEGQPVAATIDYLKKTGRTAGTGSAHLIDAYAATLQLDSIGPAGARRIRSALLDANGDGNFDHLDLLLFRAAYQLDDQNRPSVPDARDFSRFDLNGDGLTGGIAIATFDLDAGPVGGNGLPVITTLDSVIEDYAITFNEAALSDLQILCFYAYSNLYARAPGNRNEALAGRTSLLGPDHCVGARIGAQLPSQISTSAGLNVTVEVPSSGGQFVPGDNLLVDFTPTCATVSPASGRTNSSGVISTTVTRVSGCTSASVGVVARADPGTAPLASTTVTASVAATGARVFSGTVTDATRRQLADSSSSSDITEDVSVQIRLSVPTPTSNQISFISASGTLTRQSVDSSQVGCSDGAGGLINVPTTSTTTLAATITGGSMSSTRSVSLLGSGQDVSTVSGGCGDGGTGGTTILVDAFLKNLLIQNIDVDANGNVVSLDFGLNQTTTFPNLSGQETRVVTGKLLLEP